LDGGAYGTGNARLRGLNQHPLQHLFLLSSDGEGGGQQYRRVGD